VILLFASIGDTIDVVFLFNMSRSLRAVKNRVQSKLTITPNNAARTAHANLPMYFEEALVSDLEISLARAFVVFDWSMVRFVTRIFMIAVDVRLTHSLFW